VAKGGQELEVKFYIRDLDRLKERLIVSGARTTQARMLETNLRFDTTGGDLSRAFKALRLRRYRDNRITYKGPSEFVKGVRSRREIEFTVGDFESARQLLETLGYQIILLYEKYRTTYELNSMEISCDELPYGDFVEIEGDDAEGIRSLADNLGVDWEARIPESYTVLFENLRKTRRLTFRDLSFENFQKLRVLPSDLGVRPADHS
jgi:adenylate cyclase class 2